MMLPFLPDPLWFTGAAAAVGLALVASFWVPILPKRILIEALVVLGIASYISTGYQSLGERKVEARLGPQLEAARAQIASDKARADSFREDVAKLRKELADKDKQYTAKLAAAKAATLEAIHAQPAEIRNTPVAADVGRVLQPAVSAANANTDGTGVGSADQAAAAPAGVCQSATTGEWEQWAATVIDQYGELASYTKELRDYLRGLEAASAKADSNYPAASP